MTRLTTPVTYTTIVVEVKCQGEMSPKCNHF